MSRWSRLALLLVATCVALAALAAEILVPRSPVRAGQLSLLPPPESECGRVSARFAVIGDYGNGSQAEDDIAGLVKSWKPGFIITTGDNNYPDGSAATIDDHIGRFYSDYIYHYQGQYGGGSVMRRFYPTLGNHDLYTAGGQPYFDYFDLPGNERYYTSHWWPVGIFVVNSDWSEPDGNTADSVQGQWLKEQLTASTMPWKLVFLHQPPFTSSLRRDPAPFLQWPYAEWGATAVLAGHDHFYERSESDGIPYFVNGAGGAGLYAIGPAEPQSLVRYSKDFGAMLVEADPACISFRFINRAGEVVDAYTERK